jgi:phosphohistidine phosphatase SixA
MRLRFFHFSIVLILLSSISITSCKEQNATIIYLVRHAEKDLSDTTDNPPLTIEGEARAEKLKKILDTVKFAGIYSTDFDRNMNTVKPLANAKKIEIINYEAHDFKTMLDTLLAGKNKTYLICGHGNNLMPMIDYLGGIKPKNELAHDEYGNIFKVIITPGSVVVETSSY